MATSRTGTARWKSVVAFVRREAQREGLERCPLCGVELEWDRGLQPNSAEVDHLVPHSKGGQDVPGNARITCRRCNQSRGNRDAPTPRHLQAAAPLKVSRAH